ncbi:alpha/beta hydrolase [Pseudoxanthomonas sp.]|uniref:alpha/beta hydrolase n=1 Tax=Pseudoxanthomonas sp. TaxID=1871049 RepID=UPI00261D769B|nr:alpha/beta hydrolase [Pseudoxanthomonas sp.]WDS37220.1 MAG: alpha/beta hydrolase [Pseudoxanthomonas sp.]
MKKSTSFWIGAALAAGALVVLAYRSRRLPVKVVAGVGPGAGAEVLFDPCQAIAPQPETLPGASSFTYRKAKGRDLRLHVFAPAGEASPRPAVLFFFGGAWRVGDITSFQDQARAFAARGYVAVLADYRVKCRDGSTPLDSLRDAQAAYAWLRDSADDLDIDLQRIVLCGGSAGGHLALTTAMKATPARKPAAVVLFNPAVDLVSKAPMALKLIARRISPSVLPVQALPPTLIFHGQDDRTVPIDTVRRFCERASAAGQVCRLDEYVGQDHGFHHQHQVDPRIGVSPYADTLARALAFLDAQGIDSALHP